MIDGNTYNFTLFKLSKNNDNSNLVCYFVYSEIERANSVHKHQSSTK